MKSRSFSKATILTDTIVKGIPTAFIGLFAVCIFLKSELYSAPIALFSVLLVCLIILLSKFKQNNWRLWLITIFAVAFFLRLIFIKFWPITPLSDCEMAYELSQQLCESSGEKWHEILAANEYYYEVWPMHVPFLIFQTICLRVLGNSLVSIQIANMLFSSLTCVFAAMCAKALSESRRVGIIAGLLMAFNITTLFMASFLVNQHISTCFFAASMYFIIKKPIGHKTVNYIVSGVLLAVGHLMRPEMYIVLIAVLCMFVYEIIIKKHIKTSVAEFACFIISFFVVLNVANSVLLNLRWVDSSITESKLEYKLMIGLNQETEGRFQDSDYLLASNEIAVKEVLKERLSGPLDTAELMIKKLCFQFSSYNYWWLQADKGGKLRQFVINNIFEPSTQSYMFIIMLFAILSSFRLFKEKDKRIALLYIIYIGYLCAFSVMEVQQRYAYITIPIITVFASLLFRKRDKNTLKETYEKRVEQNEEIFY